MKLMWPFLHWGYKASVNFNIVTRYYELMLRNQCDLGIYLNMTLLKVEQGHFETAVLILHNFFVFYYGYRCLKTLN